VTEPFLGDQVILERGLTYTEAHILCECLRAAGIPARVGDVHFVQTDPLLSIAVGGACIRVPEARAAAARQVLDAYARGELALGEDFDVDAGT
jgi:transglutaminase-like putative cysteine protease